MGIDGIGKPPGGAPPVGGPAATGKPGESFSVGGPEKVSAAGASDNLGRLQRGEIGLDQYLDASVADATRALEGKLSAEQLDFVKSTLREQLSGDPVLVELVRKATGSTPSAG